ncbi:26 kDa secreted antigen, partial [Frankliniella fusca]
MSPNLVLPYSGYTGYSGFASPLPTSFAAPTVLSLWTGLQCLALVPGGGGAPGSVCHLGAGLTLTSADGNAIADSFTCNKMLNKTDLESEPSVRFSLPDLDRGYTIVIVDPDKPGLRYGEFQLLQIRSNIPEKELYTGKVESAESVT